MRRPHRGRSELPPAPERRRLPVTLVTIARVARWHSGPVTATTAGRPHAQEPAEHALRPHDPAWTRRYVRERDRICAALGDTSRRIEHIGSTSVPGLAAKPIVDVLVAVEDPADEPAWLPALEA